MFVWSLPSEDPQGFKPLEVFDQDKTRMCEACAVTSIAELAHSKLFEPSYTLAKACQIKGTTKGGITMSQISEAVKRGFLPKDIAPYSLQNDGIDFVSNWSNWPSTLEAEAKKYAPKRVERVWGIYPTFELICGALMKHPVLLGVYWQQEWEKEPGGIVTSAHQNLKLFPHAVVAIGQKTINGTVYLEILNSFGLDSGKNGRFYLPRKVNHLLLEPKVLIFWVFSPYRWDGGDIITN